MFGDCVMVINMAFRIFFATSIILITYITLCYELFYNILIDDCYFYYEIDAKKLRKKTKCFWRKFFFIDIKNTVIIWHYVLFWINFISFVLIILFLDIYIVLECATECATPKVIDVIYHGVLLLFCLSLMPMLFVRFGLYSPYPQDRKKYKKEHFK